MATTHGISEAELRRDLATAFRVIQARGLNDGLFNHCTVVLDGGSSFLINRFGLLWSEVTAENLVEFDAEGEIVSGEGPIYAGAAVTHAAVHGYAPLRNVCCLHLHPPWATALACLEPSQPSGAPLPVGELALRFQRPEAFVDDFAGAQPQWGHTREHAILLNSGHGVTVTAPTVAEALDDLLALESAVEEQMTAMGLAAAARQPVALLPRSEAELAELFEAGAKAKAARGTFAALADEHPPLDPARHWNGSGPFPQPPRKAVAEDLAATCRLFDLWGWAGEDAYVQAVAQTPTPNRYLAASSGTYDFRMAQPSSLPTPIADPHFEPLKTLLGVRGSVVLKARPPHISAMAESGSTFIEGLDGTTPSNLPMAPACKCSRSLCVF
eukprot:COSAG04_NODE_980_length_9017_cov_64.916797_5_plen_384_part_00